MGTEAGSVVINLESNENKPRLVEAAQILVSSAAVSNSHIDREPDELNKKLSQLIKCREEEKLAAFLETVEGYYEGQIDQESLLNAKGGETYRAILQVKWTAILNTKIM